MLALKEIAAATGGKLNSKQDQIQISGISCDSRTVKVGDLFIPLKGEHFDGHDFLTDVFSKGAVAVLASRPVTVEGPVLFVPDTLKAMQQIASYYRAQFSIPTIAVTGSAGKTTTKECIGAVLSHRFKVRVGFGNFNNHIGVPLNLFRLNPSDECAVFELGANHAGEIKLLAEIAQPTLGVITGIYPVHLEGFGSLERIYDAKLELADYLEKKQGTVIANGDDPVLVKRLKNRRFKLITFGASTHCDFRISDLRSSEDKIGFTINEQYPFELKGYGRFNALNAAAAVAVAGHLQMDLKLLGQSWKELPRIQNRFHMDHWTSRNWLIVDDSYNANPKSFEQAVESFKEIAPDRRKIIVLGDMLELGPESVRYHEALGRFLGVHKIDLLVAVGPLSQFVYNAFRSAYPNGAAVHVLKMEDACSYLASNLKDGDGILIKGSHGMELFKIKPYLEERFNITSASV